MSKKISVLLPVASLTGVELVPVVQAGVTMSALASMFGGGTINIIQVVIGNTPVIAGSATVTGLTAGSTAIVSAAFVGRNIRLMRSGITLPTIDPLDSSNYITKALSSNTITMSTGLVAGEYIRIETI